MSYIFIVLRSTLEQQYSLWAEKRTAGAGLRRCHKNVVIGCNLKPWGSLLNKVGVGLLKERRDPSKGAARTAQTDVAQWVSKLCRSLTFADSATYCRALWRSLNGLCCVIIHTSAGLGLM